MSDFSLVWRVSVEERDPRAWRLARRRDAGHVNAHLNMQHLCCMMLVMMDEVFRALSNPTRRGLLDGLREESGQSLQTLCESNDLTRQALYQGMTLSTRSWTRLAGG